MEEKPKDYHRYGEPKGAEGRETLEAMNVSHRELSEWAMTLLPSLDPKKVLDVGCGGGMQLSMLGAEFPKAHLYGVDISEDAVNFALEVNKEKAEAGLCTIRMAPAEDLPFPDEMFDLVSAFETYFFWSDLEAGISEAYRVLTPGGIFTIISELYPHPDFDERNAEAAESTGLTIIENEEMISLLEGKGFNVNHITIPEKNWVCFIAEK